MLFEVKEIDRSFYEDHLRSFLPERIMDIHTHAWLEDFKKESDSPVRGAAWPSRVARSNSMEDLLETYRLMFPDKRVTPLIFGYPHRDYDIERGNTYIKACSGKYRVLSLMLSLPEWDGEEVKQRLLRGGYAGCKVYLNFAPPYIPGNEIRIYDFLPIHQLEVLNSLGLVVMLHIPRSERLKDPVNIAQMLEIDAQYPDVKLIIAHVGRAYCPEDLGTAFEVLSQTRRMMFDISANSNQFVFEQLIKAVGPKRILFGSDLPILRMRTKRICENGTYVNLVPKGLYGDVSNDVHMREVEGDQAEKLTFFMYEELDAFRRAAVNTGLNPQDIEDVFYNNAARVLGI